MKPILIWKDIRFFGENRYAFYDISNVPPNVRFFDKSKFDWKLLVWDCYKFVRSFERIFS